MLSYDAWLIGYLTAHLWWHDEQNKYFICLQYILHDVHERSNAKWYVGSIFFSINKDENEYKRRVMGFIPVMQWAEVKWCKAMGPTFRKVIESGGRISGG